MRSALLVLALGTTQAISAPRTKAALQLRGGGLDDLDVVQVGAAALGAAGLNQWISPKASFEIYGVTKTDANALALRRGVGAWQLGLAYLLTAENPHAVAAFTAAASLLAIIAELRGLGRARRSRSWPGSRSSWPWAPSPATFRRGSVRGSTSPTA